MWKQLCVSGAPEHWVLEEQNLEGGTSEVLGEGAKRPIGERMWEGVSPPPPQVGTFSKIRV